MVLLKTADLKALKTALGTYSWTPTVTQLGAVAVTITYATWFRLGALVIATMGVTLGTGATGNNDIVIGGWPVAFSRTQSGNLYPVVGLAEIFEAGVAFHVGSLIPISGTTAKIVSNTNNGFEGTTPNFALDTNDTISLIALYQTG